MWHLKPLNSKVANKYVNLIMLTDIKSKRDLISIPSVKSYLSDEKLKWLLKSKADQLYQKIDELKNHLFPNNEYDDYMNAISKKEGNRIQSEKDIIVKYKSLIDVFNYKKYISSNENNSYIIADYIGVNSCVYCNRQYILNIEADDGSKVVRPEFDHFLPKSKYPFFALSIYNLIPSCHTCNSNCKGSKVLDLHMNPYLTPDAVFFNFTYNINRVGRPISVELKNILEINNDNGASVSKMLECFKIRDLYNGHRDLELKDLYLFAKKYSDTYLRDILGKTTSELNISPDEAYRLLFGTERQTSNNNDRPLSKFKRDILTELKIIS